MFNWFKKKQAPENFPQFWQNYLKNFDEGLPEDINAIRFVVFDTETTGFDFEKDRILCIGALTVWNNSIEVKQNFEVYLEQEMFNPETVKIHGIIQNEKFQKFSELEALKMFLDYVGNSVLVAHHARFDLKMINKALARHKLPKLKNKALDTAVLYKQTRISSNLINRERSYSLDEIAEAYNIDLTDRHTASGDAYITAIVFMKLLSRITKGKPVNLKKLYRL